MRNHASDLTVTAKLKTVGAKALPFSNLSICGSLANKNLIRLLTSQPQIWHLRNAAAKSVKSSFPANTTQIGQTKLRLTKTNALEHERSFIGIGYVIYDVCLNICLQTSHDAFQLGQKPIVV